MAYTTISKSTDYFNTLLYVGNGSNAHAITGVGFKPDFVWTKNRDHAADHYIHDIVRGVEKAIRPNNNSGTYDTSINLQSFNSDGFTLGTQDGLNKSGDNIVSWNWLAGGSQGSSNTDGSINTTYTSANTTAGISIIQYSGNGSAGATIGHGLGAAPKCVIIKRTDTTSNWIFTNAGLGFNKFLYLNDTATATTNSGTFNDTAPSASVITLGSWNDVNNSSGTYVAYAFAEKQGFSKFGRYTGTGSSNGPFVYTGFKPAFVLVKNTSASNNWFLQDNQRAGYNEANYLLKPNLSGVEDTGNHIDILSNGFKTIVTSANCNGSGNNIIYMAFAEMPLVGSNNTPALGR